MLKNTKFFAPKKTFPLVRTGQTTSPSWLRSLLWAPPNKKRN